MKMHLQPISKTSLERYLSISDLTEDKKHVIGMLYERILEYMRDCHPNSKVMVVRSNPIVSVEDNYDNLLIPKDNISRSSTYTQYIDENRILRTHTSAHIPKVLKELAMRRDWNDVVILIPGLAYRRDVTDKTHLGEIHMLEMWRVSKARKIRKRDLLDAMKGLGDVAAPGWSLRIVNSPHPYTEQGIEMNAVRGNRDIEIGEAGLINDQILKNAGLDPRVYSGWASGMGLDRLVMTLKGIPDVRYLRSANPAIAKQMHGLDPYREVSSQPAIRRDLSYSVPKQYVEEDIHQEIRDAMGDQVGILESVEILNETPRQDLPSLIRERLGISSSQKNILVRISLRHLERTLTKKQANGVYEEIYSKVNHGSAGYL